MLGTGLVFLLLARRGTRRDTMRPAADTPEGRDTERREQSLGLER
jgi:hypothetical protein